MALRHRIRSITNENHWSDLNKDKPGTVHLSEDTGDMDIIQVFFIGYTIFSIQGYLNVTESLALLHKLFKCPRRSFFNIKS